MKQPKVFFDCKLFTCNVKVKDIDVLFPESGPLILSIYVTLLNMQGITALTIYNDAVMKAKFLEDIKGVISKALGPDCVKYLTYAESHLITARRFIMLDPTRTLDRAIKKHVGSMLDPFVRFDDEEIENGTSQFAS